jgi:hypothetical protein
MLCVTRSPHRHFWAVDEDGPLLWVTVDTKGALAVMRRLLPRQARTLTALRGFRREVAARICARLRRETRLQRQAMRQLLHALFGEASNDNGPGDRLEAPPWPVYPSPQHKETSVCTLPEPRPSSKRASFPPEKRAPCDRTMSLSIA